MVNSISFYNTNYSSDSLSAENTFGTPVSGVESALLTLSGTWVGTVSIQRQLPDGTWADVTDNSGLAATATSNGTYQVNPDGMPGIFRWGFKTGNYTSGTANGTLEGC